MTSVECRGRKSSGLSSTPGLRPHPVSFKMIAAAWSLSQTVEQHWKLRSQAVGFLGLAVKEAILRRRNRDVVAVQDRLPLIAFQIEDTSWWAMQPSIASSTRILRRPPLSAISSHRSCSRSQRFTAATVSFWSFTPRPGKARDVPVPRESYGKLGLCRACGKSGINLFWEPRLRRWLPAAG